MRKIVEVLTAVVAFAVTVAFGLTQVSCGILATWVMWTLLDGVIFIGMVRAGNKDAFLIAGYALGAAIVSITLLSKGVWHWGTTEAICAASCGFAIVAYWRSGPKEAVMFAVAGMLFAGWPTLFDAWLTPPIASWWYWTTVTICSAVTIATAKSWAIENRLFPLASTIFNGLIAGRVLSAMM